MPLAQEEIADYITITLIRIGSPVSVKRHKYNNYEYSVYSTGRACSKYGSAPNYPAHFSGQRGIVVDITGYQIHVLLDGAPCTYFFYAEELDVEEFTSPEPAPPAPEQQFAPCVICIASTSNKVQTECNHTARVCCDCKKIFQELARLSGVECMVCHKKLVADKPCKEMQP